MSNIVSKDRTFFCEPFKEHSVKTTVKSGFATIEQKSNVVELKLTHPCDTRSGLTAVLVRADAYAQPWAKRVQKMNGVEFIIVPEEDVIGYVR